MLKNGKKLLINGVEKLEVEFGLNMNRNSHKCQLQKLIIPINFGLLSRVLRIHCKLKFFKCCGLIDRKINEVANAQN